MQILYSDMKRIDSTLKLFKIGNPKDVRKVASEDISYRAGLDLITALQGFNSDHDVLDLVTDLYLWP